MEKSLEQYDDDISRINVIIEAQHDPLGNQIRLFTGKEE